jgi:molybdate transport system substrate-binding protein
MKTSLVIYLIILFVSCQLDNTSKLTIATAANVQFAMAELTAEFTNETGIEAEIIRGSSGKLLAQIMEGAPYDVFVSADTKYPNTLFEAGKTEEKPAIYGYGKLVLWSNKNGIEPSIKILSTDSITHIAMANPKTAPYGVATEEILKHYGIYEQVKDKLVLGESIGQTNQFINSGAAEIGFTAKSVVLSPQLANNGKWIGLDSTTHTPIAQGVVVIKKEGKNTEQAQEFYRFLFSEKAKTVLKRFGYSTK